LGIHCKGTGFDIGTEFQKLQQWISNIPGIDEATALSSVIAFIESGSYSTVVFDTAPTGHTVKLLQLPEVLQAGLAQLDTWQAKLWGYYENFKGLMSFGKKDADKEKDNTKQTKRRLEKKLKEYKVSIDKVAAMIKNQRKTTFVTVCIAEYLSISETSRLLETLNSNQIHHSHVVVNQLIMNSPTFQELESIDGFLNSTTSLSSILVEKIRQSTLTSFSRSNIQEKYLKMLRDAPETRDIEILELPLLNTEVTGVANLIEFGKFLTKTAEDKNEL